MLASLGEWKQGELLECTSTQPLRVVGLAVSRGVGRSLLAANLGPEPTTVRLTGLPGGGTVRRLNEASAPEWSDAEPVDDVSMFELGPYETARIDA